MNEKNMDLCDMKCKLIDALKTQLSGGVGNVDAEEAGEVVDMIKDFAQTDYYEAKAHYYRSVEKAMEEGKSRGRYGYEELCHEWIFVAYSFRKPRQRQARG